MKSLNSFATALHRHRKERDLSLGAVADLTGYSSSYLSKLLHGHRPLLPDIVRKLDDAVAADGELVRIAREQRVDATAVVRPMQAPPAVADFVGRDRYLHQLDAALSARTRPGVAATILIEGGFWVGKTALAVSWVATVVDRFPGGCLFADLRGFTPGAPADPRAVLEGFLRALGVGPDQLGGSTDELAALFRSQLAQRPAAVILDNAADYDQLRPLLPGAGSVVVITSREHQAGVLLDTGGLVVDLPPLADEEALTLLRRRLGAARIDVDIDAAEAVVNRCGRLPMAVLIAADHLTQHPHQSLQDTVETLAEDKRRLDLLSSTDTAVNIRGVIDLSYLALPSRAARVFHLLGICPAHTVSAEAVAALAELTLDDARAAVDTLLSAHLIERTHAGRVRMNDLLRAYAYERAVVDEHMSDVERAHDRVLRWYVATAWNATNTLAPHWAGTTNPENGSPDVSPARFADYDAAMAWCDVEIDTVLLITRHARSVLARDAIWTLPALFLPYFYLTKNWTAWLAAASDGLAAARDNSSDSGIARSLHSLGWALHELGRTSEGIEHLAEAQRIQTELGEDRPRAWTAFALAAAYTALDRHADARDCYLLADSLFVELSVELGITATRAMLATTYSSLGHDEAAVRSAHDALTRAQRQSSKPLLSLAHHRLGLLLLQHNEPRTALAHLDAAIAVRRDSRERWGEAETLLARAETLVLLGRADQAQRSYRDAAEILRALHDPRALDIHGHIAALNATWHNGTHPSR